MTRTTRRPWAAAALVALAAGLTACGADEPGAGATTTVTETAPAPSGSAAEPTTTLTQPEAQAFVDALRFAREGDWAQDPDFPAEVDTATGTLASVGCEQGSAVPGALAVRSVVRPGAETGNLRQLAVLADTATADEVFTTLRETMRACHAEPDRFDDGVRVTETTYTGGQLELGAESFWVGARSVVVSSTDGQGVGEEQPWSTAALFVLDGTTITVIEDPASDDATREAFVQDATEEWEQLRPSLDPVMPA